MLKSASNNSTTRSFACRVAFVAIKERNIFISHTKMSNFHYYTSCGNEWMEEQVCVCRKTIETAVYIHIKWKTKSFCAFLRRIWNIIAMKIEKNCEKFSINFLVTTSADAELMKLSQKN
jgi:hypothetical protein